MVYKKVENWAVGLDGLLVEKLAVEMEMRMAKSLAASTAV